MKNFFLILIAVLAIGLTANLATAKTGGVKVDNDSDCTNGTEANTVCSDSTAYIQINASGNNFDSDISCQVCSTGTNQSGNNQNCQSVSCSFYGTCYNKGAYYYTYYFTVPTTGIQTLVVNNSSGNVGSDTYRGLSCN